MIMRNQIWVQTGRKWAIKVAVYLDMEVEGTKEGKKG
jgi:hypothetical protein